MHAKLQDENSMGSEFTVVCLILAFSIDFAYGP